MTEGEANVVIEFFLEWYDGPLTGVAMRGDTALWFEADPGVEGEVPFWERKLYLYELSTKDVAEERRLNRLFEERAKGKPVGEWPAELAERDFTRPTRHARKHPVGWFIHSGGE
jgi:hypothetical protein